VGKSNGIVRIVQVTYRKVEGKGRREEGRENKRKGIREMKTYATSRK
jgi:hypothetical protein